MIKSLLNEECEVYKPTKDFYGKESKPSNVPITKCRVKEEYKKVKDNAAEEVISQLEFWFTPDTVISLDHKITYQQLEYSILSIKKKKNTLGDITRKVVYVWMN